jgi:hypothetical protein
MRLLTRCATFLLIIFATVSAAQPPAPMRAAPNSAMRNSAMPNSRMPNGAMPGSAMPPMRYKSVLIAGERNSAAFDHATKAMRDRLLAAGTPDSDIERLSATRSVVEAERARPASLENVLTAIANLHPATGEGCFVFASSHGAYHLGLVMAASDNFLAPSALDRALTIGCGDAPTVVIVSGCFSGDFTWPPMDRPNRIILTAARVDRPSFGCGARDEYTVFDRCLLGAMDRANDWPTAYRLIKGCVGRDERRLEELPSGPQASFGAAVRDLPVPKP